mmetsp:Transcript_53744/g.117681  ORF Transcript_53744/g.117681 Transcript_53744/m.117681 type:complete len:239 (-) Transcript_53744:226-942(-)
MATSGNNLKLQRPSRASRKGSTILEHTCCFSRLAMKMTQSMASGFHPCCIGCFERASRMCAVVVQLRTASKKLAFLLFTSSLQCVARIGMGAICLRANHWLPKRVASTTSFGLNIQVAVTAKRSRSLCFRMIFRASSAVSFGRFGPPKSVVLALHRLSGCRKQLSVASTLLQRPTKPSPKASLVKFTLSPFRKCCTQFQAWARRAKATLSLLPAPGKVLRLSLATGSEQWDWSETMAS